MLEENTTQQNVQQTKSVLDNPRIMREEMALKPEADKKSKGWILKVILVLLIVVLVLYLFTHPQVIQNFVNKYFNNLLS